MQPILLTGVDYQVIAVDYLTANTALVPAWLVGVQDHQTLVGGQYELVAPLEQRIAGRRYGVAPMVVPLNVVGRLHKPVGLTWLAGRHGRLVGVGVVLALLLLQPGPLLGGQELLQILRLLDEAVEATGQVHALAPGNVHVLVLDGRVTQVRRRVGYVLDQIVLDEPGQSGSRKTS